MTKTILERFMSHVQKSDDPDSCWNWMGSNNGTGYSQFNINGKLYYAHRVAYALFINTIPDILEVCHSCDNRSCVNPDHLFLGTQQDNSTDMKNKNRQNKGENHRKHKLTEQEIYKIREMLEQGYAQQEIAEMFKVKQNTISRIKHGKRWGWLK